MFYSPFVVALPVTENRANSSDSWQLLQYTGEFALKLLLNVIRKLHCCVYVTGGAIMLVVFETVYEKLQKIF